MTDRNDALEEAAKVCERRARECRIDGAKGCAGVLEGAAAIIRALKREPAGPSPADDLESFHRQQAMDRRADLAAQDAMRERPDSAASVPERGTRANPSSDVDPDLFAPPAGPSPAEGAEPLTMGPSYSNDDPHWMREGPQPSPAAAPDVAGLVKRLRERQAYADLQAADLKRWQDLAETATQKLEASRAALSAKEAECERLRERSSDRLAGDTRLLADADARIAELEAALRPFAEIAGKREHMLPGTQKWTLAAVADVDRARAALTGKETKA